MIPGVRQLRMQFGRRNLEPGPGTCSCQIGSHWESDLSIFRLGRPAGLELIGMSIERCQAWGTCPNIMIQHAALPRQVLGTRADPARHVVASATGGVLDLSIDEASPRKIRGWCAEVRHIAWLLRAKVHRAPLFTWKDLLHHFTGVHGRELLKHTSFPIPTADCITALALSTTNRLYICL